MRIALHWCMALPVLRPNSCSSTNSELLGQTEIAKVLNQCPGPSECGCEQIAAFIGANQLGIYATLATKSPFTEYLRRRPPKVAEETLAPPPRHAAELFFLCLFLVK